jgi:hypothetical protein
MKSSCPTLSILAVSSLTITCVIVNVVVSCFLPLPKCGRRGMHIGYWWVSQKKYPRCRWVDNIKMDLREIGWGGMG